MECVCTVRPELGLGPYGGVDSNLKGPFLRLCLMDCHRLFQVCTDLKLRTVYIIVFLFSSERGWEFIQVHTKNTKMSPVNARTHVSIYGW